MTEHVLKTTPEAWGAVERGEKTFEVRKNDRCFQRGDVVVLRRLPDRNSVTVTQDHRDLRKRIGWMLQGGQYGVESGYCVFALEDLP